MPEHNGERGQGAEPNFIRVKLTPSDQLLSIAGVNLILFGTIFLCLEYGFGSNGPDLPGWLSWGAVLAVLFLGPAALATSDSWLPGLARLVGGGANHAEGEEPQRDADDGIDDDVLKGAVFVFSAITILVLWEITERTDGLNSPFVPFLTAPAVFSPFVARKPWPIAGLCLAVVACIVLLTSPPTAQLLSPEDWTYKWVAAVMVLVAGALTIVRLVVDRRGPITGGST